MSYICLFLLKQNENTNYNIRLVSSAYVLLYAVRPYISNCSSEKNMDKNITSELMENVVKLSVKASPTARASY
jgi:hypothetical protein